MKEWKKTLVSPSLLVREVIEALNANSLQIVVVVDAEGKLLGTITDGDIRRAFLRGVNLSDTAESVMNRKPRSASRSERKSKLVERMTELQLRHMPIVDSFGRVCGVEVIEDLLQPAARDNWVVLMAGGLGSRMSPLTDTCPKPMLRVGNKPLLEIILENFVNHGFKKFFISVNYMAAMIEDHFGDGSRWGIEIRYLREETKLGTAGALSLLPEAPTAPLVVMNGDLLTKVNLQQLLEFHLEQRGKLTMCVREYDFQVPFGVVKMDQHLITSVDEKPVHRFFVNAGIYVLEPETLRHLRPGEAIDMPQLVDRLLQDRHETVAFPIREYWLDVGQQTDLERALGEYV